MRRKEMENIKFLYKYTKGHRGRLMISMIMMIILSYVSIMPAKYYKEAMDNGILTGDYEYLKKVCMTLIVIYVLKSILNYITSKIFIISSQSIIFEIKKDLLKRVLKLPMTFFEGKETGYIMARVGETDKLQILFSQQTFKILISIIEFIIVLYILMKYNIKLTLIALAIMPLYYIVTSKFMGNISKISMELMEKGAKMSGKLEESISGIEEVKNLNIEEKETKKNIDYNKEFVKTAIKQGILYSIGMELLTLISAIAGVIVLLYAGKDIIFSGFTIGGYIAFANYIGKLYAPVIQLGTTTLTIQPAVNSLKRVKEIMEELTEEEKNINGEELTEEIKKIKMEDIEFSYDGKTKVLKGINLEVKKGEKIIIKGPNGSGKTTLMKLLLGIYDGYKGRIIINEKNQKEIDIKSLRERFGIVSQKIFLFNDTIKNNIMYSSKEIKEEKYKEILKKSNLEKLIEKFPLKDNHMITNNGQNLSGGQKQLIAIARALAKGADIFIFDEATVHIDKETKETIKRIIKEELKDKICFIITHEDSFDEIGDKIIKLKNIEEVSMFE
ncbi:hypothetical protein XO11_04505 [Marinitoga sp. 1138]|nr:hypothetical protein [Marinitoga sp. 1138]